MRTDKKPTSTLTEHELVTDLLIDVVGNKPVGQVTETDVRRFVDEMKRMPKNVGRRSDFAKLLRLGVNRKADKLKLPAIDKDTFVKHLKT